MEYRTAETDPVFERLVKAVAEGGIPALLARSYAFGILAQYRAFCADQCSDVLGTPQDVEEIVLWPGDPGYLFDVLRRGTWVMEYDGRWCFVQVWHWLTAAERAGWTAVDRAAAEKAAERSVKPGLRPKPSARPAMSNGRPGIYEALDPEGYEKKHSAQARKRLPKPPLIDPETNLWGDPTLAARKRKELMSAHQALIEYWVTEWSKVYAGRKYPFASVDARHIRNLRELLDKSDASVRSAIDAYLACKEPFFAGHSLSKLLQQLSKFVASSQPSGPQRQVRVI